MSYRNKKRLILACITMMFCALFYWVNMTFIHDMLSPLYFSGWSLLSITLLLIAFNLRKKLSFIPIGSAYFWAQLHIYFGFLMGFIFLLHIDYAIPNGFLELSLATIFIITFISGIFGLILSRWLPRIMRQHSETVIYERIPSLKSRLIAEAENGFQESIKNDSEKVLLDFYSDAALPFLHNTNSHWSHLWNSRKEYVNWNNKLDALRHFLNETEIASLESLKQLIYQKISLDTQYVGRSLLRNWLLVHIPLSYCLLLLALLHLVLVYGFAEAV